MAQPVFPTLARNPATEGFEKVPATDPTIRTPLADGASLVQAKFTRVPWLWSWRYPFLSEANRVTLMAFYEGDANYGAVPVKWTDPSDSTDYFVRFADRPLPRLEEDGVSWRVEMKLLEAIGTYT